MRTRIGNMGTLETAAAVVSDRHIFACTENISGALQTEFCTISFQGNFMRLAEKGPSPLLLPPKSAMGPEC